MPAPGLTFGAVTQNKRFPDVVSLSLSLLQRSHRVAGGRSLRSSPSYRGTEYINPNRPAIPLRGVRHLLVALFSTRVLSAKCGVALFDNAAGAVGLSLGRVLTHSASSH